MTQTLERPDQLAVRPNGNGSQTALAAMAGRYQISQEGLADVIKKTCIKGNCSDAEFRAFIVVANQYGLNPITREIHAFTDSHRGIVPIVGIDGWSRIVNNQPRFDGCDFEEAEGPDGKPLKTTCTMHVRDRAHPVRVTERFAECKRNTPPWNTMPFRMLRHKAFMQAARLAFSIGGIFDEDEARDIIDGQMVSAETRPAGNSAAELTNRFTRKPVSEGQQLIDDETGEVLASVPQTEPEPAPPASPPAEAERPEPDVSGADAEPPAQKTPEDIWQAFVVAADEAAKQSNLDPDHLDRGMKKFLLRFKGATGANARPWSVVPVEERNKVLAAIRDRAGYFA